jgi:hypothetical protein
VKNTFHGTLTLPADFSSGKQVSEAGKDTMETVKMGLTCGPVLSVIIVMSGKNGNLRRTVDGLRDQKIRDRIELIIVTSLADSEVLADIDTEMFFRAEFLKLSPETPRGEARLCGVRNAHAAVVAFVEDHAYPAEGWAEALLAAHAESRAAVGYQILNANPESAVSWANLFLFYGPWVERSAPVENMLLPSENISYKRDIMMHYGDSLGSHFANDYVIHCDLLRRGFGLYLEPRARVFHWNIDSYRASFSYSLMNGIIFAAARSSEWTFVRRLVYAGGSFLIPLIRTPRLVSDFLRTGRGRLLPRCLPALLAGLLAGACGEMVGYIRGHANKELLGDERTSTRNGGSVGT